MERDARYTAVGAFVLLVTAMAGLFVYWYSEGREGRDYVPYEIYFPGSVTGLSVGGTVRYLGVEVGRVRRIRLDPRSPERVQVTVEIDEATPVSEKTTAELSMLSIATGLLYVELRQNSAGREVLPAVPGERYPVINTVHSSFDAFLGSLPELAASVAELLERAKQIFSPENTAALADMVQNLHQASENLPATSRHVETLLADLNDTSQEVRRLAGTLNDTAGEIGPQVKQLAERLNATAAHLEQASNGVERLVAENRAGVVNFTQQGLPQLTRMIEEAQAAAEEVRDLARGLQDDPSRLLYQTPPRGVEVPR